MKRALCWIRRDIRMLDNAALSAATHLADQVTVVFIFDRNILDALPDRDDKRVTFIHQSLKELDEKLRRHGSQLIVRIGDPMVEIPKLAADLEASDVYTARDCDTYAIERDKTVKERLNGMQVRFHTVKDTVIMEKDEVLNQAGGPFRVFTPYSKAWLRELNVQSDLANFEFLPAKLSPSSHLNEFLKPWTMEDIGFEESDLWLKAGEDAAHERLQQFMPKVDQYQVNRNIPAVEGTSGLSVHLRFGTISTRELVRRAMQHGTPGADKWLSEVIWRDFYHAILAHFPEVVETTFDPQYREMEWPGSEEHYLAWEQGRTGYPIVDAAMRCFNATGWMHNRTRMIVASFLTKDLLVSYKKGEAYFARKLLDFDLASNSGGWQWAASVGCDAQPYFRIFNPYLQSEKFDPEGNFIKEWVPELAHLEGKELHQPGPMEALAAGYPLPIVDHYVMRDKAIALLESARKKA